MLHKDSFIISPETFQLIQQLQSLTELKDFYLVGGTALALQLGHRNSIDIDLFVQNDFSDGDIVSLLSTKYEFKEIFRRKNTIISLVDNIKTDFIKHNYPFVLPPITEEGITFLSKEDIAAMKFHAIIQSGKRLKDFVDIYYLLQHFSMQQMIDFFIKKYSYSNPMIAMKALNYFDDIDENTDPPNLLNPITLKQIKKRIQDATQKPSKIF
ncbi:MAG: nucleotidyl transferase AbiEii/AbiGii toxin family protein [Ferruginibacter sp.]